MSLTASDNSFGVDGQLALVTGASRGIGAAIAARLGSAGAEVIGTATTAEGAESIAARFDEAGIQGSGIVLDLAEPDSIANAIERLGADNRAVSILVNNAGITRDNLLLRMKPDEWNDVLQTNLSGLFYMCKACLRGMIKARSGRIINIASVIGVTGNAGQSNYAAAKAGIIGFSKSLAREVASRDITVNVVAPGLIKTAMTDQLGEEQRQAMVEQIPLGRIGEPDDVAAAVLYLASSAGAYITGETIHVNGGMYMI
jgi:3-oxoacyl-[acyl-carrier protein] reductase